MSNVNVVCSRLERGIVFLPPNQILSSLTTQVTLRPSGVINSLTPFMAPLPPSIPSAAPNLTLFLLRPHASDSSAEIDSPPSSHPFPHTLPPNSTAFSSSGASQPSPPSASRQIRPESILFRSAQTALDQRNARQAGLARWKGSGVG